MPIWLNVVSLTTMRREYSYLFISFSTYYYMI